MIVQLIVISLLVGSKTGWSDTTSDTAGLDLPEQKSDRDGTGSGSLSGEPTILDYTKDIALQITNDNQEVTLTCSAIGSDLIGGHWERVNGNPLEKSNNISSIDMDVARTSINISMKIIAVRTVHSGQYRCVVYSNWGKKLAIPIQVEFTVAPPMIVSQSTDMSANVFQNVTLSFKVVGFNVTYQWRRSDSPDIIIGTQSNFTILAVTPSDEGYFHCTAFNEGGDAISNLITLTVNRIVELHPQSAAIASGGNVTFSIIATEQSYTYHWKRKNGSLPNNAVGQNTPHLSITLATLDDIGVYHCIVKLPFGYKIPSTAAKLDVYEAPTILNEEVIYSGEEVILKCPVKDDYFVGGYWEKIDRDPLPNECNKSSEYYDNVTEVHMIQLNITKPNSDCSGEFQCIAYNKWGMAVSKTAHQVTFAETDYSAIIIVNQPLSTVIAATGSDVIINITAEGSNLKFHWRKVHHDSLPSNVVGQHSSQLSINSVTHGNGGRYICTIKDHLGHKVKSHIVTLIVLALPVITTHPNNNGPITVAEGSDVVLRCEATGEGTLNYQWRRLSGSLPDNVQGNNTINLTITNITVSDGGEYYCMVDNGGTSVFSMKVQVIVKVKPIITNNPQNQELSIVDGTERVTLLWEFEGDNVSNITCQKENGDTQMIYSLTDHTFELILDNIRPINSGNYNCTVSSPWGMALTLKTEVNVTIAPAKITVQPINKTITVLEDVKFTCIAEGFDVTYEWRHNGTTLNANTSQSGLTITQVVPSDAGHYVCIASTGGGKDVSQSATLTINGLQLTPSNLTVGEGSNVLLNCCIDNSEVFWHIEKQGVTNTTVSSPLMELYNVSEEDSGRYWCSRNVKGEEIMFNQAIIAVFGLVDQLNDTIAPVGSEVVLRCSASVSTAVNCNWKHNNTEIKDWHHQSLMLPNISLADEGSYTCEMKGNAGKAVASTAKLKILDVSIHPSNHTITVGSSVDLTCSSSISSSTLTYQWLHNGTIMKHESGAVLTITDMKIADSGTYHCMVIVDTNTSAKSDIVQLSTTDTFIPDAISSSNHTSTNQNTVLFIGGGVATLIIATITILSFIVCCCCCCGCRCYRNSKEVAALSVPANEVHLPLEVVSVEAPRHEEPQNDRIHAIVGPDQVEEGSSPTSNDKKITYEVSIRSDTSIMVVLNSMLPELLQLIKMSQLLPYLVKYGLLTTDEKQELQMETTTDYKKALNFLSSIIGTKGSEGEKNFIKALYELSKKPGNSRYRDVINKLQQKGITVNETSDDSTKALTTNTTDDQSGTSSMDDTSAH